MTHETGMARVEQTVNILFMTDNLNPNLARLLAAWRRREEVRGSGSISDLAQARWALEAARAHARRTYL